jgi:site-specific DNA-methyltransferase (adenine-specific)
MKLEKYRIYNKSCYVLQEIESNSIDALITDHPYKTSYQDNCWDKDLPNKEKYERIPLMH